MSLRVRLLSAVVGSLLISLVLSGWASLWHASRSVQVELRAALQVSAQTAANAVGEIAPGADMARELGRVVRAFDGDRHVRAVLLEDGGRPLLRSEPLVRPSGAPGWFTALLAPHLPPGRIEAGPSTLVLTADPRSEAGEVWTQVQDADLAVTLFCAVSVAFVTLAVRRALEPLDRLSAALSSLGAGDFAVRVPPEGAPELVRLATAFNAMSTQLGIAQAHNERLGRQLAAIAEEERTELARDLHDEVGPFLFAVQLDAAAIERAAESPAVIERASAIREAVSHMQTQVRFMLNRLRNADPDGGGLAGELQGLVAFWRARKPQVAFSLAVGALPEKLGEAERLAIYRLAQEGLTNAVRHGQPRRVGISVSADGGAIVTRIEDDGTGFAAGGQPGWGLVGLHERMAALGGTLSVTAASGSSGSRLEARLPLASEVPV